MSIRLSKACKDLNVSIIVAVEFLSQNGINIGFDPNLKLADEIYLLLANEFNKDLAIKIESEKLKKELVSEEISQTLENENINSIEIVKNNKILDNELLNYNFANIIDKSAINMENKTSFDIIQSVENAPDTLKKISEDFLAVETGFNSILSNLNQKRIEIEKDFENKIQRLNHEKAAIEDYTANILTIPKKQNKEKIQIEEKNWQNGNYVFNNLYF